MAVLKVVQFPHPALKTKCNLVEKITDADRVLVKNMIDTMYANKGVGLAANQVGICKQIFVASPSQELGRELVFINPHIVRRQGAIKEFEGCLSVNEFYEPVKRSRCVWLKATTLEGNTVEMKGEGLLARIFQHEVDHLNGLLFVDRLGFLKSRLTKRRLLTKKTPRRAGGPE